MTQQIGIAHRPRAAGQHEEDSLERILGMLVVTQKLAADVQDHRSVPGHQRSECGFAGGIAVRDEPIEKLAVGEPRHRAAVEERANLSDHRTGCRVRHVRGLSHREPRCFSDRGRYCPDVQDSIPGCDGKRVYRPKPVCGEEKKTQRILRPNSTFCPSNRTCISSWLARYAEGACSRDR